MQRNFLRARLVPARSIIAAAVLATLPPTAALAADVVNQADLANMRAEIESLKQSYEARLASLEARLKKAEAAANTAVPATTSVAARAASAPSAARTALTPNAATAPTVGANGFNPAISLILSGTYTHTSQDPASYRIAGFAQPDDVGPGDRGFSLGESELGVYANIDPYFYGGLNLALHGDNTLSVEEAFIQTTSLSGGATVKAGRFFSGIGYLNERHAHVWDFVDAPLAYQALLGGQFAQDGVQLRWLAPTETFIELGGEIGNGRAFPGSDTARNGMGAGSLFAHVGGDVGYSNSWRAGVSYLRASPNGRAQSDLSASGDSSTNAFTGTSRLWIADFVWKWAPNGNATQRNLKVQAEYLHRSESGTLHYDLADVNSPGDYRARQSGWYAQAVYQFMPRWRTGLRYDQMNSGSVDYGANSALLAAAAGRPNRTSWMLEYAPSEFSRLRLQLTSDRARLGSADNQVFVNYQVSLGAHGAHSY